jgi:hypothetical protein
VLHNCNRKYLRILDSLYVHFVEIDQAGIDLVVVVLSAALDTAEDAVKRNTDCRGVLTPLR